MALRKVYYMLSIMMAASTMAFDRSGPFLRREPVDTLHDSESNVMTVSLFCEAEGDPQPMVSWNKDGSPLDTTSDDRFIAATDRLTINNPNKVKDLGTYQCVAANEYGSIFSQNATLRFSYVDLFPLPGTYPSDIDLEINSGNCLDCHPPDHYPGIDVTWQKDYSEVSEPQRLRTTLDGRLCFAYVEAMDHGSYRCLVTSTYPKGGAVSYKISTGYSVTTRTGSAPEEMAPSVRVEVADVSVMKGDTIKMECFFDGKPTPSLQWRRKTPVDEPLPSSSGLSDFNQVLIINNAQPEDSGDYECSASNSVDVEVKSSGTLTVLSPPTWVTEVSDMEVDIMSDLMWRCEAESEDEITYTWYRNTQPVNDNPGRLVFGDSFRTVSISNLVVEDSAMYQCVASNDHGSVISTGQLIVNAIPPSFPIPVQRDQPAARGGMVMLICNPDGAPAPTINWYRGTGLINTGGRFNVTEDGSLHIMDVQDSDYGDYRCEATNTFSTETSTGSLIIKDGTTIIHPPANISVVVEDDAVITCGATADVDFELIYIWIFEGTQLDLENNPHYRKEEGDLHLVNVEQSMQGKYTCRAETSIDSDMKSATILIKGPPDPPTAVDVEVTEFLAEITWIPGMEHNSVTTHYNIESKTNHEPAWKHEKMVNGIHATVSDLSPWSTYQFRVLAVSDLGNGLPSAPSAEVETPAAGPSVSPSGVSGGGGNQGDLQITWEPLAGRDQNGPGVYYIVSWRQEGSSNPFSSEDIRDGRMIHVVSNVPVYTPFEVKVQSANEIGTGPMTEVNIVYSYQEEPADAPDMVEANSASSTQLELRWDPVDTTNFRGELVGYRILFWTEGDDIENSEIYDTEGEETRFTLYDLEPATNYIIEVQARSGGGEGPSSVQLTAFTKKMAPIRAPEIINFELGTDNSLSISWKAVTTGNTEESLDGYKILYWKRGSSQDDAEVVEVENTDLDHTLDSLDHDSTYYVSVLGYSRGGDGVASVQRVVKTGNLPSGKQTDPGGGGKAITVSSILLGSLLLLVSLLY